MSRNLPQVEATVVHDEEEASLSGEEGNGDGRERLYGSWSLLCGVGVVLQERSLRSRVKVVIPEGLGQRSIEGCSV